MRILISACLLGRPCRYDGQSKGIPALLALQEKHELIAVCPECDGGLPTPRIPSERCGTRVINQSGQDVTDAYRLGAQRALEVALAHGCKLAILKERSPSCGSGKIYDGSFSRVLIDGDGVTAELLKQSGIEVIGETEALRRLESGVL